MKPLRPTRLAAVLGASALLTLGAALPAHAVTNVTSGHADVVAINSSGSVGTKFGSTFYHWSGGTPAFDHQVVYNNALSVAGVTCSGGVISIPDTVSYSSLPGLGLDNRSTASYTVAVTKASGSTGTGAVSLNTPLAGSVSTGGGTETIPAGGHQHGSWTFAVGSCSAGLTHTFSLNFTGTNTSTSTASSKTIDFVINT